VISLLQIINVEHQPQLICNFGLTHSEYAKIIFRVKILILQPIHLKNIYIKICKTKPQRPNVLTPSIQGTVVGYLLFKINIAYYLSV